MAIYRLIANGSFGPDEIKAMTAAYEATLLDLGLADRDDPITEMVAAAIVSITSRGERNPTTIKNRTLNVLGASRFGASAASSPSRTWLRSGPRLRDASPPQMGPSRAFRPDEAKPGRGPLT